MEQNYVTVTLYITNHTLNMLLHYLAIYYCMFQIIAIFLTLIFTKAV